MESSLLIGISRTSRRLFGPCEVRRRCTCRQISLAADRQWTRRSLQLRQFALPDCALTCGFVAPVLLRSTGINREGAASLRDRVPVPRTVAAWRTDTMMKRATGDVRRRDDMNRAPARAFAASGAADRGDDETGSGLAERRGDMSRARERKWPSRRYNSRCAGTADFESHADFDNQ